MAENDRVARAPVLIEDLGALFRGDRGHFSAFLPLFPSRLSGKRKIPWIWQEVLILYFRRVNSLFQEGMRLSGVPLFTHLPRVRILGNPYTRSCIDPGSKASTGP